MWHWWYMHQPPRSFLARHFPIVFFQVPLTGPLATAFVFTGFVMVVDFFLVALLINRSLSMFLSLLGTWIPFALIFASTLVVGMARHRRRAVIAR